MENEVFALLINDRNDADDHNSLYVFKSFESALDFATNVIIARKIMYEPIDEAISNLKKSGRCEIKYGLDNDGFTIYQIEKTVLKD